MIYTYYCIDCGSQQTIQRSIHEGPPEMIECGCGWGMVRDWQADCPTINVRSCRDPDFIPHEKRVFSDQDRGSEAKIESQFQKAISDRRSQIKSAGGQRGSFRHTHSVPAHLYHGKIRETGDKNYWSDPKNLSKHKSCKVDE